jgi:CRP-like cAMP-binding protein
MEVLIFLKKVSLFADFELEDLLRLKEITEEVPVAAGEKIILEGESGNTAFIIVSGNFEVYRDTPKGEVNLATLEQTAYFGEMAIIENEPRSASVRAKNDGLLLRIRGPEFRKMMESSSSLAFRLVQVFSRRIRRMNKNT